MPEIQQESLDFDTIRGLSRNSDPDTSHEAGETINAAHLIGMIYAVFSHYPDGLIAEEIESHLPGVRSQSISPRFKQMVEMGMLEVTEEKRMASSGKMQMVRKALPPPFVPVDRRETFRAAIVELQAKIRSLESDALIMALRLYGEDPSTFSPECAEVMSRWEPRVKSALTTEAVIDDLGKDAHEIHEHKGDAACL